MAQKICLHYLMERCVYGGECQKLHISPTQRQYNCINWVKHGDCSNIKGECQYNHLLKLKGYAGNRCCTEFLEGTCQRKDSHDNLYHIDGLCGICDTKNPGYFITHCTRWVRYGECDIVSSSSKKCPFAHNPDLKGVAGAHSCVLHLVKRNGCLSYPCKYKHPRNYKGICSGDPQVKVCLEYMYRGECNERSRCPYAHPGNLNRVYKNECRKHLLGTGCKNDQCSKNHTRVTWNICANDDGCQAELVKLDELAKQAELARQAEPIEQPVLYMPPNLPINVIDVELVRQIIHEEISVVKDCLRAEMYNYLDNEMETLYKEIQRSSINHMISTLPSLKRTQPVTFEMPPPKRACISHQAQDFLQDVFAPPAQ